MDLGFRVYGSLEENSGGWDNWQGSSHQDGQDMPAELLARLQASSNSSNKTNIEFQVA